MLGYLSLDIICSSMLTVLLELRSRKTVSFSEQIMFAYKYPSIFSRQMETIVYIYHDGLANENSRIALSNDPVFNNNKYNVTTLQGNWLEYDLTCTIEFSALPHVQGIQKLVGWGRDSSAF